MKIAVVGAMGEYKQMGEWVAQAWADLGFEVDKIDRKELKKFTETNASILFFVDCSEDFSADIPENLNIPKVFWSMDAHMPGGLERSLNIGRKCNLVFSTNYEHGVQKLEAHGLKSYLMPITNNPKVTTPPPFNQYDVTMIGHPNSAERVKLWELLNSNYEAFTGEAKTIDIYKEAMTTSIVVNQPTEPWDIILNNRFFEGMNAEALVLQKKLKTNLIEKLGFEEGTHFIYWETFEDLKKKIDFYLMHTNERVFISRRGNEYFLDNYTIHQQVSKIYSIILSEFYNWL